MEYPTFEDGLLNCVHMKQGLIERQIALCIGNGGKMSSCHTEAIEFACEEFADEFNIRQLGGGNHTINISGNSDIFLYNDYNSLPEKMVAEGLFIYLPPFILTIGTLGNIITSIIMHRLTHNVWSTCLYLAILPISETLWLWVYCGDKWLNKVADLQLAMKLLIFSPIVCKVYPFIFSFIHHLTHWLVVATSFEGFIVIRFPRRSRVMCTFERARAVIMLLTVLLICINAQYFWTYELVNMDGQDDKPKGEACTFSDKTTSSVFQELIWPVIDSLVAEIFPITIVLVFLILMVGSYYRRRNRPSKEERNMYKYMLDPEAFCDLKKSYMCVSAMYLLLVTPMLANKVLPYVTQASDEGNVPNFKLAARNDLVEAITLFLLFIFLSCKLFVYIATCRRFRKEFLNIMCYMYYKKDKKGLEDQLAKKPLMKNNTDRGRKRQNEDWDYGRVTEV